MDTEIIRLTLKNTDNAVSRAADVIKRGGLVIFPTETVYGLGADATDPAAAKSIYSAKGRPSDNPLIIHIADFHDAEKYTYTSDKYYKLAEAFMPGPLTVVMPSRASIPKETRGGLETVAVRCPSHSFARKLIRAAGVPIAAPSANISGSPSPTSADHAIADMNGRVDMIIDGGECDIGVESTIVKIECDGRVTLLRPGKITLEELTDTIGEIQVASAVTAALAEGETPQSPGMKYRHYAPTSPLTLVDGDFRSLVELLGENKYSSVAVILYREDLEYFKSAFPTADYHILGNETDVEEQAHLLFSVLRECDKNSYDMIFAPVPKKNGMGLALFNRMIRAAAHQIIKM